MDAVDRAGGIELTNEWLRPEDILSAGGDATLERELE
jgi:hypothetical protein